MRTQYFEITDCDLYDEYARTVDVYSITDGGQDASGNEQAPTKQYYFQNQPADIQAKSGTKRAAESGTVYESTHLIFLPADGAMIPRGARVDAKRVSDGTVVESYEVVFVAYLGSHLEVDLKAVGT